MSTDALILDLSAGLTPVRRRRPQREVAMLLALGAAELGLVLGLGLMRRDMGTAIGSPYILWKLGSLAVLVIVANAAAIRSFSPTGRPRFELLILCGLAIVAVIVGAFVVPGGPIAHTLLGRLAPAHGLMCAASIIILSLPPMAMLGLLMRRAAPTYPRSSALATGLAAGTCGAFIFAFCCPMNDPLYIVVWYSTACAAVALTARWLLPLRFRL